MSKQVKKGMPEKETEGEGDTKNEVTGGLSVTVWKDEKMCTH